MNENLFNIFFTIGEIVEGPKLKISEGEFLGRVQLLPTRKNIFIKNYHYVGIFDKKYIGAFQVGKSLENFFYFTQTNEMDFYRYIEDFYNKKYNRKKYEKVISSVFDFGVKSYKFFSN